MKFLRVRHRNGFIYLDPQKVTFVEENQDGSAVSFVGGASVTIDMPVGRLVRLLEQLSEPAT